MRIYWNTNPRLKLVFLNAFLPERMYDAPPNTPKCFETG